MLVLARQEKALDGEWMATVGLAKRLEAAKDDVLRLENGAAVPFRREKLSADAATPAPRPAAADLAWFTPPDHHTPKPPLRSSPSASPGMRARVADTATIGERIDTSRATDRAIVGDAIHACIAADLVAREGIAVGEVGAILARFGLAGAIDAADVARQLAAVRGWIDTRWPGAERLVEVPVLQVRGDGQRVAGRADLLLRTAQGWVLIDHKSTPEGAGRWEAVAEKHGGRLLAYREAIEAAGGVAVKECWLAMPVAGAASKVAVGE